jgi:hypothetical protein
MLIQVILTIILLGLIFWYATELFVEALIVGGLIFLLWLLNRNRIEGFLNIRPSVKLINDQPAKFLNFDLTTKPRANNGAYPIYYWWKNMYNQLQNKQYFDCDQYRCQNRKYNGATAKAGFNLQNGIYRNPIQNQMNISQLNFGNDCRYYENPIEYCHNYPNYQLCPNHWITLDHPVKLVNNFRDQ